MTPQDKKTLKIVVISLGALVIVVVIVALIINNRDRDKDTEEIDTDSAPQKTTNSSSGTASSSSSLNSFQGRTFAKNEIEQMQSFLFNMGAMALNDLIVNSIRDSGGIDGKIGNGFKTAYNEAIRIGIINNLDDLYTRAMRF